MQGTKLIVMANQIGSFFATQKRQEAVPGIADHIQKFWDPRMRKAIFDYLDSGAGGLDEPVRQALEILRTETNQRSESNL